MIVEIVTGLAAAVVLVVYLWIRYLARRVVVGSKWRERKDPWSEPITIVDKVGHNVRYTGPSVKLPERNTSYCKRVSAAIAVRL